jgi:hypothetical protein
MEAYLYHMNFLIIIIILSIVSIGFLLNVNDPFDSWMDFFKTHLESFPDISETNKENIGSIDKMGESQYDHMNSSINTTNTDISLKKKLLDWCSEHKLLIGSGIFLCLSICCSIYFFGGSYNFSGSPEEASPLDNFDELIARIEITKLPPKPPEFPEVPRMIEFAQKMLAKTNGQPYVPRENLYDGLQLARRLTTAVEDYMAETKATSYTVSFISPQMQQQYDLKFYSGEQILKGIMTYLANEDLLMEQIAEHPDRADEFIHNLAEHMRRMKELDKRKG